MKKVLKIVMLLCVLFSANVSNIYSKTLESDKPTPRYNTTVIGITPYYNDGIIPVLNNQYTATFYFSVTVNDTSGVLEYSSYNKYRSNIPTERIPGAMEIAKRQLDKYTWEHDIYIVANKPTISERLVVQVNSPGPGRSVNGESAYISKIKYVDPENPDIILKEINFENYIN